MSLLREGSYGADYRCYAGRRVCPMGATLCGENVEMQGGVVRTASGGLAGSTLALDAAVRKW